MNTQLSIGADTVAKLKDFQCTCSDKPLQDMLTRISDRPEAYAMSDTVLAEFRSTLNACQAYTPLEREALRKSLETVLEILKVDGSDGMLDSYISGMSL